MKNTESRPSTATPTATAATSQRPKGISVASHCRSRAPPASVMPSRMEAVVASLNRALTRGTSSRANSSGREPLRAGLNRVALAPMQKSMASMPLQCSWSSPQPPASMAHTSRALAASTKRHLG